MALAAKGFRIRSPASAWLLLSASVLAKVVGTVALSHADGFSRLAPSVLTAALYTLEIWLMSMSLRDLGLAYATWAGFCSSKRRCLSYQNPFSPKKNRPGRAGPGPNPADAGSGSSSR